MWNRFSVLLFCLLFTRAVFAVTGVSEISLGQKDVANVFKPRRIALMIGVNSFKDKNFRELTYATKDVDDFRDFLKSHNTNQTDELLMLREAEATNANILEALNQLEKRNNSENDIVLVYLSSHGTLAYENDKTLKRYGVTYDTDFERVAETAISIEYLQNRLSRLISKRKALILALCHSGSGKSQLPGQIQTEINSMKGDFFAQPLHEVSSAMMVLSASSFGQPAREDKNLQNDIYTHFLLSGLKNYDSNKDGAITLFEAHEYARSMTYDFTRGQQTPSALLNLEGADPIILNGKVKKSGEPLVFADSELFRNLHLTIDGKTKGSLWEPQRVPSGPVRLALLDPKDPSTPLVDTQVYLQSDKAYSVSTLLARRPTFGVELNAYHLPACENLGEPIASKDCVAPGIGIRASEILGSRLHGQLSYVLKKVDTEHQSAFEKTTANYQISAARFHLGLGFYPRANVSFAPNLGMEYLSIARSLQKESGDAGTQTISVLYPTIGLDMRLLNIYKTIYAGGSITLLPLRQLYLKINEEKKSLRFINAGLLMGMNF